MGVVVVYFLRLDSCIFQSQLNSLCSTCSVQAGAGNVVGIAGSTKASKFGVNLCTTLLCMLQFLQNQDTSTFSHGKAFALCVKGAACCLGIVVKGGSQCLKHGKASDSKSCDGSFCSTSNTNVQAARTNQIQGCTQGIGSRGTSGSQGPRKPFNTKSHADVGSTFVCNEQRYRQGWNAGVSSLKIALVTSFHSLESTDTVTQHDSRLFGRNGFLGVASILNSFCGGCYCKLGKAAHFASFLLIYSPVGHIKILYLSGNLYCIICCVEQGNLVDSAFTSHNGLPSFFYRMSNGGYGSHSSNYNSSL